MEYSRLDRLLAYKKEGEIWLKFSKNSSTQGLTLLTTGVILTLEQENQACTAGYFIRQWRGFV